METIYKILAIPCNAWLRLERRFHLSTGILPPALRKNRERHGKRLQRALNWEHGTRIEYGWIAE